MNISLLQMPRKIAQSGYIYFVKIDAYWYNTDNCYKIGSTYNIDDRLRKISSSYGADIKLISYAYVSNKMKSEKFIQKILSNKYWCCGKNNRGFWWSNEYFELNSDDIKNVIGVLNFISASIEVFDYENHIPNRPKTQ